MRPISVPGQTAHPKTSVYRLSSTTEPERSSLLENWRPHRPWRRYGVSVLLVGGATLLGFLFASTVASTNLVMIYLAIVVIAAIYLGRGPSALAAVLGVLAFDYFLVPPQGTLAVDDTQYLITFIALLTVGLIIGTLTTRVREQADTARRHQSETMELYGFSRDLAGSFSWGEILQFILTHVGKTFGAQVIVLLPEKGVLHPAAFTPGLELDKEEAAVAHSSFQEGQAMGRGTRIPSTNTLLCMPLKASHGTIGVLGVKFPHTRVLAKKEQYGLLEAFASQAALALERSQFAEQAKKAEVLQEKEKLENALLDSISHDLRTPLVSITGALSSLNEGTSHLDPAARGMIESAYADAKRLNHLVGDLLNMSRIEAGAVQAHEEPCDVQDLIGSALERMRDRLRDSPVSVEVPDDLPLVPMDFVLMVEVLVNLLDNAVKHSPTQAPIVVSARLLDSSLELRVADRGIGIPSDDLDHVFEKFHRVHRSGGVEGTGLGLAICRGIVEVHHGHIHAERRPGGGTVIVITLPLKVEEAVLAASTA